MKQVIKKLMYRFRLVLASVLLLGVQALAPVSAFVPTASAAPICVVDTAGANDEPGQKDLTKLCVDYAGVPTTVATTWNWDETGTSGANTLDACNLFDNDNNGNIDYAVCVTTQNDPAELQAISTYSCGDAKPDRCTTPSAPVSTSGCTVSQVNTDPFPSGSSSPKDTQGSCTVQLSTVGGAAAKLIDVCSYPSGQPNSDPSDCVIAREDFGKVEVIKQIEPDTDPGLFNLSINGPLASDTTTVNNVGDNGTTGEVVVKKGSVVVSETAGTNTSLTSYGTTIVCKDLNGTGAIVGQGSPTGDASRQLTFTLVEDTDVVCTITNTRQQASLILQKTVVNDNGGTLTQANFPVAINGNTAQWGSNTVNTGSYTVSETQQPGYTAGNWGGDCDATGHVSLTSGQTKTCTITNNDVAGQMKVVKNVTNDNGGSAVAGDFTLSVNGQAKTQGQYFSANAGTYTVTESGPSGYTQTGLTCVDDNTQQAVAHPVNLALAQSVTCTVTNDDQVTQLTVTKHVVNNNGGSAVAGNFTMNVTATSPSSSSFPGNEAGTTITLFPGSYSVDENSYGGYAKTLGANCSGSIALGEHKYCTITNDDIVPLLTLIKNVVTDDGGLADASDWLLTATGPASFSGTSGVHSDGSFIAGTYALSESDGPDGYTQIGWNCEGGTQDGSSITLAIGQNVTCTVTNDDQAGKLIVKKVVHNDNGGTKEAKDFSFSVNGDQSVNFEADGQNDITVKAGTYSVVEDAAYGYTTTYENCNNVAVANGETETCTVTNDDIAPTLTIEKRIKTSQETDQTFGFTSVLGDFSLAGGESKVFDDEDMQAGSYTVTEGETTGWQLTNISCRGLEAYDQNLEAGSVTVTLHAGDNVTCRFTNEQLSTISGFKFEDVNGDGEWDTETEDGLQGWTIKLGELCWDEETQDAMFCDENDLQTTVTHEDGSYSFENLQPGWYLVCEVQQEGWIQTAPSGEGGNCHQIYVKGCGQVVERVDFGNFKKGEVKGVKFNDVNGNHQRDAGEPTLANWEIKLTKMCPVVTVAEIACQDQTWTTKTNGNGAYSFGDLLPGDYKVCETQQATWTQTYPQTADGCHLVTLNTSGQVETKDFGNKAKPQVLGETLVNTGTSTTKGMLVGLSILGALGALHLLTRRKSYAN